MRLALPLMLFSMAGQALAASGGHGEAHLGEHQIQVITYQAINLGAIAIGLFYFLRKPVKDYFKQKHANYMKAAEIALEAQRKAESEHLQIQVQLSKLESTKHESLQRAKAEAADLRNSLVQEAQVLSKRIQEEMHATAQLEVQKAKIYLRQAMVDGAIQAADQKVKTVLSREDHARLNGEFVANIEAAQT